MDKEALKFLWYSLCKSLHVLSSSAEEQLLYLKELGDVSVDELAVEFDEVWQALKPHIESELYAPFYEAVTQLDNQLNAMSGKEHEALWSYDSLINSDDWHEVRCLANVCKFEFEELVRNNNQSKDLFLWLERRFSKKEKGEAYWKARAESKRETQRLMGLLHIYLWLIVGFLIVSGCFYRFYIESNWIKTDARITHVKIYEESGIRAKKAFVYELQYSIDGENIQSSKGMYGLPDHSENETITILVNPDDLEKIRIFEPQITTLMMMLLGLILVGFSGFFILKRKNQRG